MTTKVPVELSSTPSIVDNGDATAITIDSSERVGIGTTSPSTLLHLSASNDPIITLTDTGFGASADITGSNGNLRLNSQTATLFDMADSEIARFTSSGNLGIGTTSPNAKLDILGTTSDQLRLRTAESEEYKIGRNSSTGFLDFSGTQSGYTGYRFGGVDGERMIINSSGNVGIGCTPTHTLHAPTARLGEEKWLNSVSAYYISSGTLNRNLTIDLNGSAEYYIIIYLVGIWPYTASAAGTRIIEVTGYGSTQNAVAVISNAGSGGNPTSVTVTASGGNLNLAINYNNTYRWNASAKVVYGTNGMTMSVDGTNG